MECQFAVLNVVYILNIAFPSTELCPCHSAGLCHNIRTHMACWNNGKCNNFYKKNLSYSLSTRICVRGPFLSYVCFRYCWCKICALCFDIESVLIFLICFDFRFLFNKYSFLILKTFSWVFNFRYFFNS